MRVSAACLHYVYWLRAQSSTQRRMDAMASKSLTTALGFSLVLHYPLC